MLYFANQSEVPCAKEVIEAMIPYFSSHFVSPLSHHTLSKKVVKEIEKAKSSLYDFVGASSEDHFVLTSSGCEAINHLLFSTYVTCGRKLGKNHFLTTTVAEAPAIMGVSRLQEFASVFELVPVTAEGVITVEALAEKITLRTSLLSLSWANGLTGVVQPIQEIAELCKERDILLHVDATHVLGKGEYNFTESGADFLTFNGEQLHGPKGSGALFIKKGIEMTSFIVGDKEQEQLRSGGYNLPALIGLAKACELMKQNQDHYGIEIASLRALFEKKLDAISLNPFKESRRIPNVTTLIFPKIASDALTYYLDREGLYATFGGNNFQKLSHILKACALDPQLIHSGVSFSFCRDHTREDIEKGAKVILDAVEKLSRLEVTV